MRKKFIMMIKRSFCAQIFKIIVLQYDFFNM